MVRLAGFTAINEEQEQQHDLEETVEARESRLITHYENALLHVKKNDDALAEESFRLLLQDPLIQTTPNEQLFRLKYLTLKNLASLLARNTSKLHDAIHFYCLATEIDDTDVSVWNRLGTLAAKIQQWSLARRAFERGLALDYTHPTLQAKLFQLLTHIGDRPGTEQLAAALLQAQPDNALAREMSRFSSSSLSDTEQRPTIPITCQLMQLPPVRESDLGQQDDGREAAAVVITEEYTLEERSLECLVKFIADKIKSNSGLMQIKLPPKPVIVAQPEGNGRPEEQQQPTDDDATAMNFDTKDDDHQTTTIAAAPNQDDDPMKEAEQNSNDETSAPADNQQQQAEEGGSKEARQQQPPPPVIVPRESKRQKIKYLPGTATNAATGTTILGAWPSGTTITITDTAAAAAAGGGGGISTEETWLDHSQDFRDDILPLFQPPDCTAQSRPFSAESQGRDNGGGVSPVKKKEAAPITAAASSSVPTSEELQAQLDDALEELIATLSSLDQQGSRSGSISITPTQLGVHLLYALGKFSVPLPRSTWRDVMYIMGKVHSLVDTEGNRQMCLALGAICADVAFMVASDVQQSVAAGPTSPMMTICGKENTNNGGKKQQKLNATTGSGGKNTTTTKADDQSTTTNTNTADKMADSELLDHARALCSLWLGRYQCQSYNEHDAIYGQEAVHWWIQGRLHQATNIGSTCSNDDDDNNNNTSSNVEAQMCYMASRAALLLHTQEYMQEQDDDGDIGEEGAVIDVGCCHMDNEISLASIRGKLEILQLDDVALQAALAMKENEKKEEGEGGIGVEAALVSPPGAQPCSTSHTAAAVEEEQKEKQRKGYEKVVDLLTIVLLSCDDREDVMRKTNRVKWQETLEMLLKAAIATDNWKLALQCHLRLLDAVLPAVPQEILSLALGEGVTHTTTNNTNNNSTLLGAIASYIQALKNASQSTISGACIQQAAAFLSDKCDHLVTLVYDASWGEGAFSNMELQIMRSTAQKALFAINIMGYAIQNIKVFDTLERLRQMRDGVDATYPIMVDLAVITFHLRQLDFGATQNANNTYDVLDYLAVTLGESGEVPLAPTGGGGNTKKQRSSSVLKRNGIFVRSAMRAAKYEIERMKDMAAAAAAAPSRATRTASVRQRNQQHPSKTAADKDDDDDVTVEDLEGVLFKCIYWLYGIRVQHIKLESISWGGATPLEACTSQERSARLHSKQVCLELWPLLKGSIAEADDAEEPLSGYDPFFIALIDVVCQPPSEEARLLFEHGWKQLQTEEPPTFEDIISSGDGGDGSAGAKTKAKVKIPSSITQASKAARDTHVSDPLMLEIHTHVYYWRTLMQDPVNEWVVKAGMKREFLLEPEFESNFEQMLMYNKLDLLYNPERQDSWKMLYDAYLTVADVVLGIAAELVSSRVWQHQTSLQGRIAIWRNVETWCSAYAYLYAPSDEYKRYVLFFLAVRMARQLDELPPMYNQFTIVRGSSGEEQNKLIEDAKTALSFLKGAVQLAEDSDAFMLHILIGKTLKKMGRPADEFLAHLALACHVATKAFEGGGPTDVFFELHAARLRALMKIGIPATNIGNGGRPSSENKLSKENKAALLAVGKYCFLTETVEKIAAAGKIHDSKMHSVLIGDCIAAMKWCLEKNKYFYKASWMLVKLAMYRRDKEAALAELAPFFSSPKARHHVFMVNMFIVSRDEQLDKTLHATSTGRSTTRKRRGRGGGGAAGGGGGSGGGQLGGGGGGGWEPAETEYGRCPVKQLGVFAAQTDAQHVKNLRKFLVTYIRLCAELGALKRLQAADEALETSNNSQAGVDGSGQGQGQGIVKAVRKKTLVFNSLDDLAQFIRGQYIVVLLKKLLNVCPADTLLNKMVTRSSDNGNGGFSSVEKRTGPLALLSATTPASTVRQQQKMHLAEEIAATINDENADADNNDGNADEEGDGTAATTTTSIIVTPTSSEEVLHMAYKLALEHSVLQGEGTVWNSQILAPAALALSDESQDGVEEGEGEGEEGSAVAAASKQMIQTVLPHSRKLFLKYAELYCRVLACQTSLSSIEKLKALLIAFQSYFRREKITPKQASPAVRQTIKLLTALFVERLEREQSAATKTAEETVPDLEDRLNAPPPSPGKQSLDTIVRNVKSNLPRLPENATDHKSEDKKARVEYLKSVFLLIADDDRIRLVKRLDRELEADQVEVLSQVCTEIGQEYPQRGGQGDNDGEGGRNGDNNTAVEDETMLGNEEIQLQDRIGMVLKIMVEFKFLKVIGAWMNQEQQQKKRKKEARNVVEGDEASGARAPVVSPLPAATTTTNDAAMTPAMPLITAAPPPVVVVPPPTTLTRSIVITDPITSSMSSSLADVNKQVETCIVELYKLYAAIGLTPCPSSHSEVAKAAEELVKVLNKQSEARKEEEKKKRAAERAAVKRAREEAAAAVGEAGGGGVGAAVPRSERKRAKLGLDGQEGGKGGEHGEGNVLEIEGEEA